MKKNEVSQGSTEKPRPTYFCLTKGKDMHIVKIGDAIEQRIVVRLITPTAVTLRESQSGVEETVPLTP